MESTLIEIAKMQFDPGDVLIVKVPLHLRNCVNRLNQALSESMPSYISIIVCPSEIDFIQVRGNNVYESTLERIDK